MALEKEAQELEKTCLELLKQIEELELKQLPRSRP
jgi:hypothetical protein